MADIPVVYTLTVCPACDVLRNTWRREGIEYEERRVDQSQTTLDEALDYADTVPIIVYPDGRVEIGFQGHTG
jgi:glutaredoxin